MNNLILDFYTYKINHLYSLSEHIVNRLRLVGIPCNYLEERSQNGRFFIIHDLDNIQYSLIEIVDTIQNNNHNIYNISEHEDFIMLKKFILKYKLNILIDG